MRKHAMFAYSPLEVGDMVIIRGLESPMEVTEIETVFSARTGETVNRYYFDGWKLPLECVECRLVDGERIPLSAEVCASREVS